MQRYVSPAQLQIRAPKGSNVATGYNIECVGTKVSPSTDRGKETVDIGLTAIIRSLAWCSSQHRIVAIGTRVTIVPADWGKPGHHRGQ